MKEKRVQIIFIVVTIIHLHFVVSSKTVVKSFFYTYDSLIIFLSLSYLYL